MIAWGGVYGVVFGLALLATRPFLPGLFGVTPDVRLLLLAVLLIVAAQQPVSGVVFVLDGALIGAGDQDYLALAGLVTLAVFGLAAAAVVASQAGLVVLWLAYSLWMLARLVTLTLRARGSRWLITGAVRNPSDRPPPGRS
jgi:Na+-driven multidrug efflux pump